MNTTGNASGNTTGSTAGSTGYFDGLAELLRAHGLPPEHADATVEELAAHLAETGGDPEDEFGPADEFARQLVPTSDGTPAAPESHVETWRWAADTYVDEELLNRFGDEGWEVERVDALGRFVSHRDPERPQRWEYRRELIARGREGLDEKLAPDGWEECGSWLVYAWFKRPRAASEGPAAELDAAPPAPARSRYRSRRSYLSLAGTVLAMLLISGAYAWDEGDPAAGLVYLAGMVSGLVILAVPFGIGMFLVHRRRG